MAIVNPDPHQKMYRFMPSRCVTATFETPLEAANASAALQQNDFDEQDIRLYVGEEGAEQIDVDADRQSMGTKLLQAVTKALADDAGYLERAAAKLRQGGALISVSVGEDQAAAERATAVLKQYRGEAVQHWSDWTTEQL